MMNNWPNFAAKIIVIRKSVFILSISMFVFLLSILLILLIYSNYFSITNISLNISTTKETNYLVYVCLDLIFVTQLTYFDIWLIHPHAFHEKNISYLILMFKVFSCAMVGFLWENTYFEPKNLRYRATEFLNVHKCASHFFTIWICQYEVHIVTAS